MSEVRLGALVDLVSEPAATEEELRVAAEMMLAGTGRLDEQVVIESDGRGTGFQAGDVLFGKLRPYLSKSWVSDRSGEALGDIHVYRPRPDVDPRFIGYVVLSDRFLYEVNASTYGAKMPRANWNSIKAIPTYVPTVKEQRRVADYLDRETATVDALIEKQRQLAAGLRERRSAVCNARLGSLVGQGDRLKWSFTEIDRRAGIEGSDLPVLSVSIDWGVRPKSEAGVAQSASDDTSHYKVVEVGDVVINRMRAFQGGLGVSSHRGVTSPDYGILRVAEGSVLPQWLALLMRTSTFVGEMVDRLRGIGTVEGSKVRTPRISLTDIGEIRVAIPTVEDQRRQIRDIHEETAKIDALIAKAQRFIELAQERRAALITDAVTGRIEIPAEETAA